MTKDPLTSNQIVENWRSYCDSTPGFTAAATRNMFRDLSGEIERLTNGERLHDEAFREAQNRWADSLAARDSEIERLRAALKKYGKHNNDWQCAGGCLCGFSAALAGAADETTGEQP